MIVVTAGIAGRFLRSDPEPTRPHWTLTTGDFWEGIVRWINVNFFDALEAFKNALLLNVLIPVKRFLGELPWLGVVAAARPRRLSRSAACGSRCSAWCCRLLIAVTGQWEKATVTVYLCGISVVFACLIGMPIARLGLDPRAGVAGRRGDRRHAADAARASST